MTESNEPLPNRSRVVEALHMMPGWKRKLLGVSLVVGLVGAGGELMSSSAQSPPTTAANTTTAAPSVPGGTSGFVSGQPAPPNSTGRAPTSPGGATGAAQDAPTAQPKGITPWMRRVGLSFFVGIVIGLIFRAFLKLAAGITLLIGGLILALSYFHVLNIDMTGVKTEYASASAWLGDQASRLKDVVLHALPSSSSAAVGFLSGFKRR